MSQRATAGAVGAAGAAGAACLCCAWCVSLARVLVIVLMPQAAPRLYDEKLLCERKRERETERWTERQREWERKNALSAKLIVQ
uniref:Uncharacterized protein n=1 Tax=Anopheles braziliensis TaxID=58242 RepID=A0A2M3ZLT7_9DIPT